MANTLGSVVIEMAVNLARLRSDFGTAAQISQTRLREIERNAARTVREIGNVGRAVQTAFGVLGVSVGLTALVYGLKNAAMAAIDYGDEIAKAQAKTGVAGSTFSELAYAARQNDVALEALTTAFKKLQVTVSEAGGGSKTALATFRALGIEFEQLRKLSPDRQFEQIAEQISRLKDPADKTRAAVELFGRAGADLLPLFEKGAQGIRTLREEAVRTGRALTDDQIEALSDADLAIKQLTASWEALSRSLTARVAPSLISVLDTLQSISQVKFNDVINTLLAEGPAATWKDLQRTVEKRLNDQQRQARESAVWSGLDPQLMKQGAASIRPSAPPGFKPEGKKTDATDGLSDINIWQREVFDLRNEMDAWMESFNTDFTNSFTQEVNGTANSIRKMSTVIKENKETLATWTAFAEEAAAGIQSAFADFLFDPFKEGLRGMLADFVDVIRRMIAEWMAMQVLTGIGGALGKSSNSFVSSFGNFLAGKRAEGGPVTAGAAYLVGERGPELFMPRSSGTIIPNGAGGGVSMTYNIDARGADADRIMAILPPLLRQNREQTIADMMRLQRQGRFA